MRRGLTQTAGVGKAADRNVLSAKVCASRSKRQRQFAPQSRYPNVAWIARSRDYAF